MLSGANNILLALCQCRACLSAFEKPRRLRTWRRWASCIRSSFLSVSRPELGGSFPGLNRGVPAVSLNNHRLVDALIDNDATFAAVVGCFEYQVADKDAPRPRYRELLAKRPHFVQLVTLKVRDGAFNSIVVLKICDCCRMLNSWRKSTRTSVPRSSETSCCLEILMMVSVL